MAVYTRMPSGTGPMPIPPGTVTPDQMVGLDVPELAERTLNFVAGFLSGAGVSVPERRTLLGGISSVISWDCEMLAVTLQAIDGGAAPGVQLPVVAAGQQAAALGLRHVNLDVILIRSEPTGTGRNPTPSPGVLHQAAKSLFRDAGVLSQALVMAASTRLDGYLLPGCLVDAARGRVNPVGPLGDTVGLQGLISFTAMGTTR